MDAWDTGLGNKMNDVNAVCYHWMHIFLSRLHCGLSALFKLPCSWIWCFASQRGVHAHLVDHESKFPDVPPELSQPLAVFLWEGEANCHIL